MRLPVIHSTISGLIGDGGIFQSVPSISEQSKRDSHMRKKFLQTKFSAGYGHDWTDCPSFVKNCVQFCLSGMLNSSSGLIDNAFLWSEGGAKPENFVT